MERDVLERAPATAGDLGDDLFVPHLPEWRDDPYPFYDRLRETDPVHYWDFAEFWVLSRYDDNAMALKDDRFGVAQGFLSVLKDSGTVLGKLIGNWMLVMDPPSHTRVRGLVNKAFTPRSIARMEPRIERAVDELIAPGLERGHLDVMHELADPLPTMVLADLLGVSEDRELFIEFSKAIAFLVEPFVTTDVVERADRALASLIEFIDPEIEERRARPRDDFLSELVLAEEQGDKLTNEELYGTCVLFLLGARQGTSHFIGNAGFTLLSHPSQLRLLRDDWNLLDNAIEELLRFEAPAQMTARTAMEPVDIGGKRIGEGDQVIVLMGAANRDPDQFSNPHTLDITRSENQHLSFSGGVHFCLGASVARMQGKVALTKLLRPGLDVQLKTPVADWDDTITSRGLKTLEVEVQALA